jgi:hypothetical protein
MRTIATLVALAVAVVLPAAPGAYADEKGEKVTIDQVPAPVKATIEKEAKGGTIGPISKETAKGRTSWEVQITKNGEEQSIHVGDNGKVLKRENARTEAREESRATKKELK